MQVIYASYNLKKLKVILLFSLILSGYSISGQKNTFTISGFVEDSASGERLIENENIISG